MCYESVSTVRADDWATTQKAFMGLYLPAELAYAQLCEQFGLVWFCGPDPVHYSVLLTDHPRVTADVAEALGWRPARIAVVNGAMDLLGVMRERLQGVVGWLLTEPTFLSELGVLRGQFEALAEVERDRKSVV